VLAGSRAWSEKNRRLQVRFLKGWVRAVRWLQDNEGAATEFMIKEFGFKPAHARRAWQYYAGNKAWDYDGHVNLEGMKAVIQMTAEQNLTKGPLPSPTKYVDENFLNEALRELKEGK
jgi:ABC-type nitrate/sulfonate/bicarbonate transport system substrate-binding protein